MDTAQIRKNAVGHLNQKVARNGLLVYAVVRVDALISSPEFWSWLEEAGKKLWLWLKFTLSS